MSDHYLSQRQILINGIIAFEPVVMRLHKSYKDKEFSDWPTIVLGTTLQTSAISLSKLLPFNKPSQEPLDKRSIASIIRNIIDTHDVLDMLINVTSPEEFNLHQDILGLYLSSQVKKVQSKIKPENAQKIHGRAASHYWRSIKSSNLYKKSMDRIKSGESIFYTTRDQRVRKTSGAQADVVMGVIVDLSTYVHSIPPALWMGGVNELYADNTSQRDVVSIWLRVANFYLAQCFALVLKVFAQGQSSELKDFIAYHKNVFAE
ncbi:MAG: hypothetical protein ACLQDF_09660 [Desulfomonilia bacterium]